jgi:hypothetical protein
VEVTPLSPEDEKCYTSDENNTGTQHINDKDIY